MLLGSASYCSALSRTHFTAPATSSRWAGQAASVFRRYFMAKTWKPWSANCFSQVPQLAWVYQ